MYKEKSDQDLPDKWKTSPELTYIPKQQNYQQIVDNIDSSKKYDVKHQIIDTDTGKIIDEIFPTIVESEGATFGTPGKNTVRSKKKGDKLMTEWIIDDVPDSGESKALVVSILPVFEVFRLN